MAVDRKRAIVVAAILAVTGVVALAAADRQHFNSSHIPDVPQVPVKQGNALDNATFSPAQCHIINASLPDPYCTPGAADPRVTQENIHQTICLSGYSKSVRPPPSVTEPMKLASMKAYGFTDSPSNYEYDHLIPLELGGAPKDVNNLWPEPGYGAENFNEKDKLENYLHSMVCSGSMTLARAQHEIAANWLEAFVKEGLS